MKRIGLSVIAAMAFTVFPAGTQQALAEPAPRVFTASAEGTGFSIQYGIPGYMLLDKYLDGGGPTALAQFQSVGSSTSSASFPYPGWMQGYPGLWAVVAASAGLTAVPGPPGYPFFASAAYPTSPETNITDPSGFYSMKSTASASGAHGAAQLGSQGGEDAPGMASRAIADVSTEGSLAKASAISLSHTIHIGPLSVESVRSQSVTTYAQGDEKSMSQTELLLEGGKVGPMEFSYGPGGLKVSGNGVPVDPADGLRQLNAALKPSGLAIGFESAREIDGGASAAAFEILHIAEIPSAGDSTFRLRFGAVSTSVTLAADGASSTTPDGIAPTARPEVRESFQPASPAHASAPSEEPKVVAHKVNNRQPQSATVVPTRVPEEPRPLRFSPAAFVAEGGFSPGRSGSLSALAVVLLGIGALAVGGLVVGNVAGRRAR